MNTETLVQLEAQLELQKKLMAERLDRRTRYIATRSHFPTKTAREVFEAVCAGAPWVKQYPKSNGVYNPRFMPDWARNGHYRFVENTDAGGLRWVGWADEIAPGRAIDHNGWFTDPRGEFSDEILRGAVWQLPARNGRAQYVHGYVDPHNDGAALVCFDIDEGDRGVCEYGKEDAAITAAYCADRVAELTAESEREYRLKEDAAQRAEELRGEAAELRESLCAEIKEQRARIAKLLDEARDVLDNPYQLLG